MADQAHVTSVEAIDLFRASLLVYVSKVKPLLEDACDEVSRTRQWLQSEQRMNCENLVRRRTKEFEAAQQALFSAGVANLRDPGMAERAAMQRAKRALTEAEDKLKRVKRWGLEFDNSAGPMVKQFENLRTLMANDLPKAVAYLSQVVQTLDAYANVAPSSALRPSMPTEAGSETGAPSTAETLDSEKIS